MKQYLPIGALMLVFLALAVLYSFVVPLGEGPDEPGHAAYVFFLAREGRLPVQRAAPAPSDVQGEGHQPPLAYMLAAPTVVWLAPEQRQFDLPGNLRFTWAGGGELNAVAHGSREYLPWRGAVLAWHLARLVSAALGAVTVLCTYLAARAVDLRFTIYDLRFSGAEQRRTFTSGVALLAAALVAFNPQFLFVSALVTNDALLVALSAVMLWLVLRAERRRFELERWRGIRGAAVIGLVLGLALLTKQSALMLVPVALLGALARGPNQAATEIPGAVEGHVGRRPMLGTLSSYHLITLARCVVVLGVAALVAGWWYVRNWRLYGDLFGLSAFRAEFMTQPFEIGSIAAWGSALAHLHDSFWARFGWMNVPAPAWVLGIVIAVELVASAGWLRLPRPSIDHGRVIAGSRWSLVALPLLGFGWIVSFAATAGLVAWQGRLLFPALPALAILLAYGLGAWGRPPTTDHRPPTADRRPLSDVRGLGVVGAVCWVLIVAWMPFGVIRPAYPFHTLPEGVAQAQIGVPVYGRFGKAGERGAELRGWRLVGAARPGSTPELVLTWYALARQNRDWVVFIHLVGAGERIEAEDNRPPQDGAFPMTQWVAGDWVEDRHPLPLPADLAAGTYTLRVGLYDPGTGERTGVYDRAEKLSGDYLDIGRIVVE